MIRASVAHLGSRTPRNCVKTTTDDLVTSARVAQSRGSTAGEKAPGAVGHGGGDDAGRHALEAAAPPRPHRDRRLGGADREQGNDGRNHGNDQSLAGRDEQVAEHRDRRADEIGETHSQRRSHRSIEGFGGHPEFFDAPVRSALTVGFSYLTGASKDSGVIPSSSRIITS